jgi:hypothetical protein
LTAEQTDRGEDDLALGIALFTRPVEPFRRTSGGLARAPAKRSVDPGNDRESMR